MSDIDDVASGALRRSRRMVVAREAGLGRSAVMIRKSSTPTVGEPLTEEWAPVDLDGDRTERQTAGAPGAIVERLASGELPSNTRAAQLEALHEHAQEVLGEDLIGPDADEQQRVFAQSVRRLAQLGHQPLDAAPPTHPTTTLTGEKHDAYVAWVAATRAVESAQAMADQVIAAARQPLTAAQEAFREALQRLAKAVTA